MTMKRLMLLVFTAAILTTGCEDIQDNTPALQSEIDGDFFRANDAIVQPNADGSFTIRGFSSDEVLTLHIWRAKKGEYIVGAEDDRNWATFQDFNGNLYSTNPLGEGKIVLTDKCVTCPTGFLTGTFTFRAIIAGVDTLDFSRGVFFEVPFSNQTGDNDPGNAGSFTTQVNGNAFSPTLVSAVVSSGTIIIGGADDTRTVLIRVPTGVEEGTYDLPFAGFSAAVAEGGTTEEADTGTIVIVEHNTDTKVIKGTFSFETASNTVSQGQFNVTYN